jgi:hypothetical protein
MPRGLEAPEILEEHIALSPACELHALPGHRAVSWQCWHARRARTTLHGFYRLFIRS